MYGIALVSLAGESIFLFPKFPLTITDLKHLVASAYAFYTTRGASLSAWESR
jgi:hypothetical protein